MEPSPVSQALAESFWQGWIPTDLPRDFLEALDLSALGSSGFEELEALVGAWDREEVDLETLELRVRDAEERFRAAARVVEAVEDPGHEALRYLLEALREALQAMGEACAGVVSAAGTSHFRALRDALSSGREAAAVLQELYDGTHFEG